MNAIAKLTPAPEAEAATPTGLALLRVPFPAHQISKLPKPFKADSPKGNCKECGGYHGLPAVHLDYVGHAALTDRLLDADPEWSWEPVADPASHGLAVAPGGMWIRLTVCGVTRYGFGHPDGKTGGNAVKEVIGDALRNAAMRFGAALDLWHKGELHAEEAGDKAEADEPVPVTDRGVYIACQAAIDLCDTEAKLTGWANDNRASMAKIEESDPDVRDAVLAYWKGRLKAVRAAPKPKPVETFDVEIGDEIPFS